MKTLKGKERPLRAGDLAVWRPSNNHFWLQEGMEIKEQHVIQADFKDEGGFRLAVSLLCNATGLISSYDIHPNQVSGLKDCKVVRFEKMPKK